MSKQTLNFLVAQPALVGSLYLFLSSQWPSSHSLALLFMAEHSQFNKSKTFRPPLITPENGI